MLIFTSHNLNHCFESRGTLSLWNVFEAVQRTRSTCFIGSKNTAACFLNVTLNILKTIRRDVVMKYNGEQMTKAVAMGSDKVDNDNGMVRPLLTITTTS